MIFGYLAASLLVVTLLPSREMPRVEDGFVRGGWLYSALLMPYRPPPSGRTLQAWEGLRPVIREAIYRGICPGFS